MPYKLFGTSGGPSYNILVCEAEASHDAEVVLKTKVFHPKRDDFGFGVAYGQKANSSQVGTGERSEKIRTYNYPQSRVTDHRINLSSYNLPAVMDGDIEEFVDELATRDEAQRLAAVGLKD